MAPLAPNLTVRWKLHYTTCGVNHTLLMRSSSSVDAATASTAIDAFLTAIESQVYELSVNGFEKIAEGSSLSFPAVWGGDPTYGTDDGPRDHGAAYIDFVGRSTGGIRVRAAVFGGRNFSLGEDFRVAEADSTVVDDAITALTANVDAWQAADGLIVTWHRYFNIGTNAYWRNKIR